MNFRYCDGVALVFLPKNAFLLKYGVKMPLQASIFTCIITLKRDKMKFCPQLSLLAALLSQIRRFC